MFDEAGLPGWPERGTREAHTERELGYHFARHLTLTLTITVTGVTTLFDIIIDQKSYSTMVLVLGTMTPNFRFELSWPEHSLSG